MTETKLTNADVRKIANLPPEDEGGPPQLVGPCVQVAAFDLQSFTAHGGWVLLDHFEVEEISPVLDEWGNTKRDDRGKIVHERQRSRRYLLGKPESTALAEVSQKLDQADECNAELREEMIKLRDRANEAEVLLQESRDNECHYRSEYEVAQDEIEGLRTRLANMETDLAKLRTAFGEIATREALESEG